MLDSTKDENYYLKYGLEKDPFPSGVIDKNIYLTPEINRRLKHAKQLITHGEKLLTISSLPGAGKSLLAEKLLLLKEDDWQTCLLKAKESLDIESLSLILIQQLLPDQEIEAKVAISMLHKYLETSYKEGIVPVIVIDDGDKLSHECLQFVLQLADLRYNESQFRIVIFANEAINETFAKAGISELAENAVEILNMPGFRLDQVQGYLKYRFSACGNTDELPFTEDEIQTIHSVSGGLAGGIHTFSRQIMMQALTRTDKQGSYGKFSLLLAVLVLSLAAYIYYDKQLVIQKASPVMVNNDSQELVQDVIEQTSGSLGDADYAAELSQLGDSISLKLSEFDASFLQAE